jgi:DNA-binding transcriptional ArsR family regulator
MANHLGSVLSAIADPTRRAVVEQLGDRPATVSELHAPHDMALPTFLKHLKVLERAGVVRSEKKGRIRTVHLEPESLVEAEAWFDRQKRRWERRLDRLDELVRDLEKDPTKGRKP